MYLTRHQTSEGPRWAVNGTFLVHQFTLGMALAMPRAKLKNFITAAATDDSASGQLLAPVEPEQEVWASGVTYLRSRDARVHESEVKDVYEKVYDAERPELFFKANGWRVKAHEEAIRIRKDSTWNVPEPELTLVINRYAEIVGYSAGNDVSSRDIEGDNPLYLPQAKIYNGSCAMGPGIVLADDADMANIAINMTIERAGKGIFEGDTSISQMKRSLQELADYLLLELEFPDGVFLLTGAGIVPSDEFTLKADDKVSIHVGELNLNNSVQP